MKSIQFGPFSLMLKMYFPCSCFFCGESSGRKEGVGSFVNLDESSSVADVFAGILFFVSIFISNYFSQLFFASYL